MNISDEYLLECIERGLAALETIAESATSSATEDRLREALIAHRADLHNGSNRPCATCRESARALGIVVPNCCARFETDKVALDRLKGDEK